MNISNAWINGRTLTEYLSRNRLKNQFGRFGPTDRVQINVRQHGKALGVDLEHAAPFVIEGNLLVTMHDLEMASSVFDFTNLRFTENALSSALSYLDNDEKTQSVESLGRNLDFTEGSQALKFSEAVCDWGRGHRVWGNLIRKHHSPERLGRLISSWLLSVTPQTSPIDAIAIGAEIKGLGVSFASKHLRLYKPERFATLDDVLSKGLGYALNPQGFNLFISDLHKLKVKHQLKHRIADLETGIFILTRQIVRGRDD